MSQYQKGILFLILAQLMVAISIVASKIILVTFEVPFLLFLRFTLGAIILFSLHFLQQNKSFHYTMTAFDGLILFLQAICAGVLFNFLMMTGLDYTDANMAGVITSFLPTMIALFSIVLFKEKITPKKRLAIFMATVGLVIISVAKLNGSVNASHSFFGDFIIFLSLIPETSYYLLSKRFPNKLPIYLSSGIINAINACLLLPVFFLSSWHSHQFTLFNSLLLILIGSTSGFFYVFWFKGALSVDGATASLTTAIMPIATLVLAYVILNEGISFIESIGMICVIASIII
jgi:drug/metabolite transporter (DMT)-like permease